MEHEFWHDIWASGEIGFHENAPNTLLTGHFSALGLSNKARVFLPLCGKTGDIAWLLNQGYCVVGAELSEYAIKQLFEALSITPKISSYGDLIRYSAENIDIWVGDIFDLTAELLGSVDVIYDRAAIIALPEAMRVRYAQHLMTITSKAPQLIVTYEYDQPDYPGPPFSVGKTEIERHYQENYLITLEAHEDVPGGLKGLFPAKASAWQLVAKQR